MLIFELYWQIYRNIHSTRLEIDKKYDPQKMKSVYREIYTLCGTRRKNQIFAGVKRIPMRFADIPTAIYSSKTFGIRASCDTEEVDPRPEFEEYNEFIENAKKTTEKLDFKVDLEKMLVLKISSTKEFQKREKTFKFAYLCCYIFDEKTNQRRLVTKYNLYNYEQQSMKDLMKAICVKKNVYIWILHCGNENYEEIHKIKSAREFDDCLAAVITLDFYSVRLYKYNVEQFVDKFDPVKYSDDDSDVNNDFLKYYFRVSFDKETKEVRVRMYSRVDASLQERCQFPDKSQYICHYKYIGDYNYYDTNVVIGVSAICNDPFVFHQFDRYPDPSTDAFINTLRKNPESYSKLQDDLIKGIEFQSRPTKETYDANYNALTSDIAKIEYTYNGYDKSSKISMKNDYFCPKLITPCNIEEIYTYANNIYFGIGFDRENNLIIDNAYRDEFIDVDKVVNRYDDYKKCDRIKRDIRHIRLLMEDGSKISEIIRFNVWRYNQTVDIVGNTYYSFGEGKTGGKK